jgi:predicted GNAT family N-acyltransferase
MPIKKYDKQLDDLRNDIASESYGCVYAELDHKHKALVNAHIKGYSKRDS